MERRTCKRWRVDLPARFALDEASSSEVLLKDISMKGARFVSTREVPESLGKNLPLNISLDLEKVNAEAEIIWQTKALAKEVQPYVGGLKFNRLSDIDKKKIFNYIFNSYPRQIVDTWWEGISYRGKEVNRDV